MLLSIKAFFIQLVLRWLEPFVAQIMLKHNAQRHVWIAMYSMPTGADWREQRLEWLEWLIQIAPWAEVIGSEYPHERVATRLRSAGIGPCCDIIMVIGTREIGTAMSMEEWLLRETLASAEHGLGPSAALLPFALEAKETLSRKMSRTSAGS